MASRLDAIFRRQSYERRIIKQFDSLIETPHTFDNLAASSSTATNFSLPANGRLAISHSASLPAGHVSIDVGANRSFSHPALNADEPFKGGLYGEEGQEVVLTRGTGGNAGTFSLYVVTPSGVRETIATCTFI